MAPIFRQENLKVSYQFINWILDTNRGIMGHLYHFISATQINDFFTDLDTDVSYIGANWRSDALRFDGLRRKIGIGLNVDEQNLKIWAAPTDTLFGANFLQGVEQGLLDGAIIERYRMVWKFATGNAAEDIKQQPLAVWPLFTGFVSTVTKGGSSHVELKVKSALLKLNVNMPRNYYQPGCLWTLFDPGCQLDRTPYTINGTVSAGITSTTIPLNGGITAPIGADGLINYAQGRLTFNSGVNTGLEVLIDNNDDNALFLAYPLTELPNIGDAVTYLPGCSKSFATCTNKFGNQIHHRGYDKVPPIMLSV